MQHGRVLECLGVDALCNGGATHPYTRQLLHASRSYSREEAGALDLEAAA
jgi:peptide/nickel transport system ATP-binding protein